MDPEPVSVSKSISQPESPSLPSLSSEDKGVEEDDPFVFKSPSIALLGIAIAITTVGIPIVAVITERPERESMVPTALETDGPQKSLPVSLIRSSEPSSRDTSREQE